MSSVNRNSPRLRDIMAAFNIPDQEELATRGSTTPMSEVNTPAISNMSMMPHSSASTHSALAGCVPSSSPVTSIPMSSHSGSPVPIVPSPRLSSPYAASVHQQSPAAAYVAAGTVPTLHGKSPLIQQSVPAPVMAGSFSHSMAGPKSAPALPSIASLAQSSIHQPHPLPPAISQSHGQAAQPHHTQGPALAPPGSLGPPVYKNGPSGYQAIQSEFHPAYCHQHEEAIEYYARNQPEQLLVYSAEDWPAPESVASNHPDSSRVQGKALPPYSQGSGAPEAGGSSSQPARNQPMHGSVSPAVSSSAGGTSDERAGCVLPDNEKASSVAASKKKRRSTRVSDLTGKKDKDLKRLGLAATAQERKQSKKQLLERNQHSMSVPGLKGLRLEECDPFKEFRAVMTEEHRNMIASGLSDEDMLMLMEELQDRLRAKQRLAMRARRARFTEEQREAERVKNRERKRMVRQNPLLEFKRIMTDEQRKLLLQPNLDPLKRAGIIAELVAIRKWIQREQARERRARLSEDKKSEVRRKSREYKRKARNNPLQAFRCVMTEKHYELLQQDLDQEQREGLITELIELKKAKQREETRARRAGFSPEQKERERKYSREYKRMQRQRGPAVINYQYDGDSEAGAQSTAIPDQPPMVRPDLTFHRNQNIHPGTGRISLETPSEQMYHDAARQKIEETKVRNRERQRLKRAMQTEEEKEEERRKNRERSRLRRMKLAEEARTHYLAKLHLEDLPMEEERDHGNLHEQNLRTGQTIPAKPYEQTDTGVKSELDRPHGIMPEDKMMFDAPTHGQAESVITNPQTPKMVQPICAPWFSEALLLNIRKRNRESTQRSRANMTEEQREMERARNRERQRLKRLMQTPEERAAYALKQKLERRRRRQDPRYRERERQRQRERKKQMRQFPWYRARENDLCYLRKARQAGTSPRSSVSSAVEVGQGYENTSPKEGEERGEGSRDEGAFYVDVNVPKQGQDIGGEEHPREGPQQDDERLGKISGSVFGMHRIEPLNTMPGNH